MKKEDIGGRKAWPKAVPCGNLFIGIPTLDWHVVTCLPVPLAKVGIVTYLPEPLTRVGISKLYLV